MADETVNVQVTGAQTLSGPADQAAAAVRRLEEELQRLQESAARGIAVPQSAFSLLNEQIAEQIRLTNSATDAWQRYAASTVLPPPPPPRTPGGPPGGRPFESSLGPESERTILSARASAATLATSLSAAAAADAAFRDAEMARATATAAATMRGEQAAQRLIGYSVGARSAADAAGVFSQRLGLLSRAEVEVSRAQQAMSGEVAAQRLIGLAPALGQITAATSMFAKEVENSGGAITNLGQVWRHSIAIIDGLLRGQRGQVAASFNALVRDSNLAGAALGAMASGWGIFAVAGVGALAAVGYATEQAYQKFLAFRATAADFAIRGLGTGADVRTGIAEEFKQIQESGNEWAAVAKNIQEALNALPPAALASRNAIRELGTGIAGLKQEDAAKEIEGLAKAAEKSPVALAKLVEEQLHLQGSTTATGQSLESLARSSNNAAVAIQRVIAGANELRRPVVALGNEANKARNDLVGIAASLLAAGDQAGPSAESMEQFVTAVGKAVDPTKNAGIAVTNLSETIKAQDEAIQRANTGIQTRINLIEDLARVEQAAAAGFGEYGQQQGRRQQQESAADTLSAQLDRTPPTAGEEKRHQQALENIRAEAEARRADLTAQLQAAQARTAEELRFRSEVLTRPNPVTGQPGMSQQAAEERAKNSVEYQKLKDDELKITRQIEDQKNAITVDGLRARAAEEQRGTQARISAQLGIIALYQREVDAGRKTPVELAAEWTRYFGMVRQLRLRDYQEAQARAREEVELAEGSVDKIIAAYDRLRQAAAAAGQPPVVTARIDTEETGSLRQAQQAKFQAVERQVQSEQRLDQTLIAAKKASLGQEVAAHAISKAEMATREEQFTEQVMAGEEQKLQTLIATPNLTSDQYQRLYEHLAELYAKDAERQLQAQEKVTAAIQAENDKRAKSFTSMFDTAGSALEKFVTDGITRQATLTKALQSLGNSIVQGLVKEAGTFLSDYAGRQLGPLLNLSDEQSKGGLGSVLGTSLFKALGLEKEAPKNDFQGVADKFQKAADAQGAALKLNDTALTDLRKATEALTAEMRKAGGGTGRSRGTSDYGGTGEYGVGQGSDYAQRIKNLESGGGNYNAVGPVTRSGDRGYGAYQVMGANVPSWSRQYYGQELTPSQFLGNRAAQDAVFQGQFGSYVAKYGPEGAARAWFAGEGGMNRLSATDVTGTSVGGYGARFRGMGRGSSGGGVVATAPIGAGGDDVVASASIPPPYANRQPYSQVADRYGSAGEYGVSQSQAQLKTSVDQLTSKTQQGIAVDQTASTSTQQLTGAVVSGRQAADLQKTATDQEKTATDQQKLAVNDNTQALKQAPAAGGGGAVATTTSGLTLLTQGLGIAASAAAIFGRQLSPTARAILGTVGVLSQLMSFGKGLGEVFDTTSSVVKVASTATNVLQLANTANTVVTTANTIATAANSAAQIAGAAGSAGSGALGLIAGGEKVASAFFLRNGGIIPSAAGGMLADGGQLSILHPREMVLPASISSGLQNLIAGGGTTNTAANSNTLNYNPQITGYHPYGSRSQFEEMLRDHSSSLYRYASSISRNPYTSMGRIR